MQKYELCDRLASFGFRKWQEKGCTVFAVTTTSGLAHVSVDFSNVYLHSRCMHVTVKIEDINSVRIESGLLVFEKDGDTVAIIELE